MLHGAYSPIVHGCQGDAMDGTGTILSLGNRGCSSPTNNFNLGTQLSVDRGSYMWFARSC